MNAGEDNLDIASPFVLQTAVSIAKHAFSIEDASVP